MKLYAVTKNHVRKFIQIKYHTPDIEISYITKSFIKEFFAYLQGYKRDPDEKVCQNNAAIKHVQRVSHLLTIAEENEWIDRNPCQYFHPKTQQKDRGYLTEEEIQAIANLHGLIGEIKVVRDLFLFAVYTGMAWVDVYNLTTDNIQTGIDGELWIEYSRKKTTHSARVPILQPVLEIMKTYEEQMNYNAGKRIFPLPTNQEVNRYLKRIAELAHVKKNITYHIARHTFATTITLLNNVPIETVSKMLGHASIASTQIYAKVVDKKIMNDTASIRELYAQKSIEKKKASNY
ncbi:tyrosine-type recombinase/integrase [Bacteroides fragilis]